MTALWWARRDLRLHDNPAALQAAAASGAGVFPWTPAIHFWSGRRRAHLARVLWSLGEDTGGALGVRRGAASEVVSRTAAEIGATTVWAQEEFSPSGIREQEQVRRALEAEGRELRLTGSSYAIPPGTVRKSDGTPYRVFTPFRAAWRDTGWPLPAPPIDSSRFGPLDSDVDLDQRAAHGDAEDPLATPQEFRESRLLDDFQDFVESRLALYGAERDRPDLDTTSHLSTALAFGQVHPRTILTLTRSVSHESARTFESEIAWRDFHADTLWHHPEALRQPLSPVLADDDWRSGDHADADFIAWREGRTGFPLVDAGMRQLAATGWMHNRVRMVVASFLVKDLRIPWQRGADWFRRALVDYDHAQNQLNWQWVAGTGRDAAPFFRVFNPTTQRATHDPHRRYVERWVAELDTPAYPMPIVDHAHERETTLALHRAAKSAH